MFEVDTIGLNCPLPVIKAEKALDQIKPGERLVLLASDPLAAIDIPLMCNNGGHVLCSKSLENDVWRFEIEKAK